MANWKKLASGAAGAAGGAGGLDVDDVFNVYAYTGNASSLTITNGIDLSTEGGAVWAKQRDLADHHLITHEAGKILFPSTNEAQITNNTNYISSFNSNGFTLGPGARGSNSNNYDAVAWTFRKAPKFFDVVTYTGNGVNGRQISHNLGTTVGSIFVKCTSDADLWPVFHRTLGPTKRLRLNTADAASTFGYWYNTAPTDSVFTVNNSSHVNGSGRTYVAYLFAHNNDDGEFGPNGDQDIIKCGGYTGTGQAGLEVNLGFEPQWLLIKHADGGQYFNFFDSIRGIASDGNDARLLNTNLQEFTNLNAVKVTATGFIIEDTGAQTNNNNSQYVYWAIRRGPLAAPTDAADVFDVDYHNADSSGTVSQPSGFATDMVITTNPSGTVNNYTTTRHQGENFLLTDTAGSEQTSLQPYFDFATSDGVKTSGFWGNTTDPVWYHWRRAPSFFDAVAYTGNGGTNTIAHNLGVAPEMIWVKCRDLSAEGWHIGVEFTASSCLRAYDFSDSAFASGYASTKFVSQPTATNFVMGNNNSVGASGQEYIAYLFASLAGVSKIGTYTGDSTNGRVINCGFSNGAKFVLVKATNASDSWWIADTTRGINAGNDPLLKLNKAQTQISSYDEIDYHSSGFIVNYAAGAMNYSGTNYIFYAIAA